MSDSTGTVVSDVLRVLVVGDTGPIDDAMDALSSQLESVSLVRERTPSSALERLAQLDIHCVVCPLEAAQSDRDPTVLERLRDREGELPIIAVGGDGSASESGEAGVESALEAGATDVVDADDPRSLIATRVSNAAERYRLATGSDRRTRSVLERSDALVWVVSEAGAIEYASPAVESRMGYTPDELERRSLSRLAHPDDRETVRETLETVTGAAFGASERVSVRLGHAGGRWRVYELTLTNRLADPLVEGIVLTLSDAAGGSLAPESAALGFEADARTALERLSTPLLTLGPQWELRYANEAARRLFVADVTAEPGTVVWDLLDERVRGQFFERLHEASETTSVVEFEATVPSLEHPLAVTAYPGSDGVTVTAREVSDTDSAAVDRERFDLLESAVDAFEDGLLVLEDETVKYANAALFELTDRMALVGRDLDAVFDGALATAIRERAQSSVVRWMDPLLGTLAGDGRAVDVFVTPLPDDDRTLCVVRDRRRSSAAALSTVREGISAVRNADSYAEVRQSVLETAGSVPGADLAAWYRRDLDALRPVASETTTDAPVDLPPIDLEETELLARLEAGGDTVDDGPATDSGGSDPVRGESAVFDRAELDPVGSRVGIRAERVLVVQVGDHGVVLVASTDPMAFGDRDRTPLEAVAGAAMARLDALEGESALRSVETELERLEALVACYQGLSETERALFESESRAEIDRHLCEALVSLDGPDGVGSIELAWIGDVSTGSERITPDAWAGPNGAFLESITVATDDADHPTAIAAETLEPAVVADIGRGEEAHAWRARALERGFRSAMSVPLVADEFCYGTLTLYAEQPSAFDEPTRRLCTQLAATASFAIAALERKRALLSDRVTELEIVLRDRTDPLSSVAHHLDRSLDVQAVVPRSSDGSAVFCTVSDVDDDSLQTVLESISAVESGRRVGERADATLLELVLSEPTVATTLADHGGVLRSITPVDDRSRLVVDLSSTVDVRSFVGMIERTHPGAELVARRERDRSTRPTRAFETELRSRLSERQLRTLETAYYGGFFEWPRESTGETVAESLGVSQPTFSRHLRLAQHKLFALLFDERLDSGED